MNGALVDRIYEAAFVPELWSDVLRELAQTAEALSGALLIYDGDRQPRWRGTPLIDEVLSNYCTTGAWRRSELTPYMVNVPPAAFFHDADYFPEEVLARDFMRAPLRALGIGSQLGTLVPMPSGENVVLTVELPLGAPRPRPELLAELSKLRPHFARAGLMAARLGLEKVRTAVATLAALGLPAAIVREGGRVLAVNALLENMEGAVVFAAQNRLALSARTANILLQQAIQEIGKTSGPVRSIPVPARDGQSAFIAHVVPIAGAAHDIFTGAAAAVVVTPVSSRGAPDNAMLNGLFDLTPAEARLAQHLAKGDTVGETADLVGVSVTTVRSQLSSIFAKTGTTRQAELTGLLSSLGTVRPGGGE